MEWMKSIQAPLSMVLVQIFTLGMLLLSKIILNRGTFIFALLAYRNAIGAIFVAPLAFFFERICGAMGLYYYGLRDTTATYSTAFLNLIPAVTFILSAIVRMERLGLDNKEGIIKVLGTLVCVGGAMVICFYKGKELHLRTNIPRNEGLIMETKAHNLTRGTMLLVGSCLSYAFWFIVQVKLSKVFPSKYWATLMTCIAGCFQSVVLGLLSDREASAWRLGWDLQLLTIVYSGALNTAASYILISSVIAQRGPLYPPMFNPLTLIFVAVIDSVFMGQDLTVGSLLGIFLIIFGLYAFLWGKTKELQRSKHSPSDNASNEIIEIASQSTQAQAIVTPDPAPHKL